MPELRERNLAHESILLRAVQRILRPLVRQLLRHGITYRTFTQVAKRVYYEVAAQDFALPGKRQTDSRIALLTGLTRRDVAHLRSAGEEVPAVGLDAHLATKLIDVWCHDARYRSESGTPLPLPFEARQGGPTFVELVRRVGGDIPPRALLDELVRVGSIQVDATRTVRLLQRAYIPAAGSPERLEMLGEDIAEFARAIAHNLEVPPHDAFLQQKVVYDNVGSEALGELRAELRRLGEAFLRRVNKIVAARDRDRNPHAPGGRRTRVVMGVYYFDAEEESAK